MHCDIDYSHMIIIDTLHYAKIHKTITVLPPQSSGIVPLNDPFKTSVPAKYGQTTFRALPGLLHSSVARRGKLRGHSMGTAWAHSVRA